MLMAVLNCLFDSLSQMLRYVFKAIKSALKKSIFLLLWMYYFLYIEKMWKGGLCWRIWRDCSWLWMKLLMEGKWWQGSGQERKKLNVFELDKKGSNVTQNTGKKGSVTQILLLFCVTFPICTFCDECGWDYKWTWLFVWPFPPGWSLRATPSRLCTVWPSE